MAEASCAEWSPVRMRCFVAFRRGKRTKGQLGACRLSTVSTPPLCWYRKRQPINHLTPIAQLGTVCSLGTHYNQATLNWSCGRRVAYRACMWLPTLTVYECAKPIRAIDVAMATSISTRMVCIACVDTIVYTSRAQLFPVSARSRGRGLFFVP